MLIAKHSIKYIVFQYVCYRQAFDDSEKKKALAPFRDESAILPRYHPRFRARTTRANTQLSVNAGLRSHLLDRSVVGSGVNFGGVGCVEALSRRPPFPVSVRPHTLSVVAFGGHYNIGSNSAANHKGHF